VYLATASLASGIALGTTSQRYARGHTGRRVPRRLHQASLISSLVFLGASAWSQRRSSVPAAAAHATALVVLSTLPLTSAGRRSHIGVASAASALHGIGVFIAGSNHR
jgi:hypothetical protein